MNLRRNTGRQRDLKSVGLYILTEIIGKGRFGVVKKARHCVLGEKVAIKIMDKSKVGRCGSEEVSCLKLVQHPNVVRLLEVIESPTELMVVLELGEDGNLYDYVSKNQVDELTARSFFVQMVRAVQHCHSCNVVHRDVKMENMVLFNRCSTLKLTDFGFSSRYVPGCKLHTSCGSLAYSAPEILIGDTYQAPAVDVWSLGVMLFMLVAGRMPFDEATESETLVNILDAHYSFPTHLSQSCLNLISKMLRKDPEERIGVGGVLMEDWVEEGRFGELQEEGLSEVEESFVVHRMVASNIASKQQICRSLQEDAYSHVSACYHLLAGRLVSKRHCRAMEQAVLEREGAGESGEREDGGMVASEVEGADALLEASMISQSEKMDDRKGKTDDGVGRDEAREGRSGGVMGRGRGGGLVRGGRVILSGLAEASENEQEEDEDEKDGRQVGGMKESVSRSVFGGMESGGECWRRKAKRREGKWHRSSSCHLPSLPCTFLTSS